MQKTYSSPWVWLFFLVNIAVHDSQTSTIKIKKLKLIQILKKVKTGNKGLNYIHKLHHSTCTSVLTATDIVHTGKSVE